MESYKPGSYPGILTPPKAFEYIPNINFGTPILDNSASTYLWPASDPTSRSKSKKRSKKHSKHRSKSHKAPTEHHIGAYVLQVIGVLCLILAAVRSFEPLTGVGFTLVLIGYNQGLKKTEIPGTFKPIRLCFRHQLTMTLDVLRKNEHKSKDRRSSSKQVKKRREERRDADLRYILRERLNSTT